MYLVLLSDSCFVRGQSTVEVGEKLQQGRKMVNNNAQNR